MTKPTAQPAPAKPIVVLYAISDGKGRAGIFKGPDIEPALKAAGLLKFSVLTAGPMKRASSPASCRPAGIKPKAKISRPLCAGISSKSCLLLLRGAWPGSASYRSRERRACADGRRGRRGKSRLPLDWADIKRGDLVVAQARTRLDGLWQAIVVDITGDLFKFRWSNEPRAGRY